MEFRPVGSQCPARRARARHPRRLPRCAERPHAGLASTICAQGSDRHNEGEIVELSGDDPSMLMIPPGVAHGFYFAGPASFVYGVSHHWDPVNDEFGCRLGRPGIGDSVARRMRVAEVVRARREGGIADDLLAQLRSRRQSPVVNARVRVGLAGCGRWGRHILRDLKSLGCWVAVAAAGADSRTNAESGRRRCRGRERSTICPPSTRRVVAVPTHLHGDVVLRLAGARVSDILRKAAHCRCRVGTAHRRRGRRARVRHGQVALPHRRARAARHRRQRRAGSGAGH